MVWIGCSFKPTNSRRTTTNTRYGVYSTHGFYNHHSTQLSLALVKGDNESILSQISFDQTRFTRTGVARRL